MAEMSEKMKYRTEVLSVLNKYRNNEKPSNKEITDDIEKLKKIPDKVFLAKSLFNELLEASEKYANVCAIMLIETTDSNLFQKLAIEVLKSKKISDEKKFFVISLIKQKGIEFNYDDISMYIEHPEKMANDGIEEFLVNAVSDPEVQIDLLDFYQNIPKSERITFIENLKDSSKEDNIANAFSLICQLNIDVDEETAILAELVNLDTPYALKGLDYILKYKDVDIKTREKVNKVIENVKRKYPDFIDNDIIKTSKIYKSYISFVDGNSNFSLVFSRKREDNLIDTFLVSINLLQGVLSCMGFGKIEEGNFIEIIKRLFKDSMPVEINPIALKSLLHYYYDKNYKTKVILPYEFITWKNLLNDVQEINYDVSDFLNSKLETINLNEAKVRKLISSKMLENWFYSQGQNEHVDKLIKQIEIKHITNFEEIEKLTSNIVDNNFLNNKNFLIELQSRLLIHAYVAKLAGLKISSAACYSMCFKNPYLKAFVTSFIDKSIYYYLCENLSHEENKNIFKKEPKTNFSKEEINTLILKYEAKWK